jgi:hypothetical protein
MGHGELRPAPASAGRRHFARKTPVPLRAIRGRHSAAVCVSATRATRGSTETRAQTIHRLIHKENDMQFANDHGGIPAVEPAGAAEQLLDARAKIIVQQLLERAEKGDPTALRLCMERIMPPLRALPVQIALPPLEKPADAIGAIAAITAELADGALTAAEALDLARMVRSFVETLVLTERSAREAEGQRRDPLEPPRGVSPMPIDAPRAGEPQLRWAA